MQKTFKTFAFAFLTVCLTSGAVAVMGCGNRGAGVYRPTFTLSESVPKSKIGPTVKKALLARRWVIEKEAPGMVQARYVRAQISCTIKVTYTGHEVKIDYVDSQNLKYSKNGESEKIHRKYKLWIQNLERDIQVYANQG